jgi:hypothetical protein
MLLERHLHLMFEIGRIGLSISVELSPLYYWGAVTLIPDTDWPPALKNVWTITHDKPATAAPTKACFMNSVRPIMYMITALISAPKHSTAQIELMIPKALDMLVLKLAACASITIPFVVAAPALLLAKTRRLVPICVAVRRDFPTVFIANSFFYFVLF